MDTWLALTDRNGRKLALTVAVVMLALLSYQVYQTVNLFWPKPKTVTTAAIAVLQPKLPDITQYHLFGEYQAEALDPNALPKTQLNLSLLGVFAASPQSQAYAVITVPGAKEMLYTVGQAVPGGAIIYKIMPKSVVLKRNNRYEVLELPKNQLIFGPSPKKLPLIERGGGRQ